MLEHASLRDVPPRRSNAFRNLEACTALQYAHAWHGRPAWARASELAYLLLTCGRENLARLQARSTSNVETARPLAVDLTVGA